MLEDEDEAGTEVCEIEKRFSSKSEHSPARRNQQTLRVEVPVVFRGAAEAEVRALDDFGTYRKVAKSSKNASVGREQGRS